MNWNNLFASRKDDPKAVDIKSMIQSLVNGRKDVLRKKR